MPLKMVGSEVQMVKDDRLSCPSFGQSGITHLHQSINCSSLQPLGKGCHSYQQLACLAPRQPLSKSMDLPYSGRRPSMARSLMKETMELVHLDPASFICPPRPALSSPGYQPRTLSSSSLRLLYHPSLAMSESSTHWHMAVDS